jgi:glycosyltransferase involved in cell wall biosynthesis
MANMSSGENKRLTIVVSEYSGGGAEDSMRELTTFLMRFGYKVQLIAINESRLGEISEGEEVVCLGRKSSDGLVETAKKIHLFNREVKKFDPSVIILNCELPELFGSFLQPKPPLALVVEHTTNPWKSRKVLGVVVRLLLKFRNFKWITVVFGQRRVWPFKQRPLHIANPVSQVTESNKEDVDLIFIGRLAEPKHPELLLEISRRFNLSVDFFGDGHLRIPLENCARGLPVRFWGFVLDPWRLINKKSIVVFPSEYEGDGKAIVEAILHGNPVLLRDNIDLRRFNLPEVHYFKTFEDLLGKVEDAISGGADQLQISDGYVNTLRDSRSLESIGRQWLGVLEGHIKLPPTSHMG